jgi:hypothetical protein
MPRSSGWSPLGPADPLAFFSPPFHRRFRSAP